MQKLAFIFTENDLKALQSRRDFGEYKVIAVTPEADFVADRDKIPYAITEEYYDEIKLNKKGVKAHKHVEKLCDALDQKFFSNNTYFSAHDIYLFLKILYDQLLFGSTIMEGIVDTENPAKILLPKLPPLQKDLWVNNDDLLVHIMACYCKQHNIAMEEYSSSFFVRKSSSIPLFNFKQLLSKFKWRIFNITYNLFKSTKTPSLFIVQHWDFKTCVELRKFFKVFWLRDLDLLNMKDERSNVAATIKIINLQGLERFFHFKDVCLLEVIKPKLEYLVCHTSAQYEMVCKRLYEYYHKKRINMVIAASGQSLAMLAAVKTARKIGLPVVWGQHGGLYGYGDFPIHNYLVKPYTHYFLYTPQIHEMDASLPYYVTSDSKLFNLYRQKRYAT